MEGTDVLALGVVLLLTVAHVIPPRLAFTFPPRSWVLSAASGISVAYVFVHLLPEIADAQATVEASSPSVLAGVERHAYVVALSGLTIFYGLERAAIMCSPGERAGDGPVARGETSTGGGAFWLSTTSFGLYNAIVGYLVIRRAEHDSVTELALFAVAIALHFLINDLSLRSHHRHRYDRVGRPILVAGIIVGWLVGVATELSEAAVGLAVAFLAGGIILNVMKEEVPRERQGRFLPLALGAVGYAALLVTV